jgi:antitoxin component of MazEF toxin-antitoxin module
MIKNLTKHGNSYSLVIDRAILELLDIEPDTPLSIETDGKRLLIEPIRTGNEKQRALERSMEKINQRYGKVLKKLAE